MILENLNIRSFSPPDQEAAQQLVLSGLVEHFEFLDPSLNLDLLDIKAAYLDGGDIFLVAEINGQIIGTGALVYESPGTFRIVRVSVALDKRRVGIGQAVVKHLLVKAREIHTERVLVETNIDWHGALAFYESLGFTEYTRDPESVHLVLWL